MLVSVIIPVYNVAPYIEQCLQSVLSQTFNDLEVLIVDDCGIDDSIVRCEKFIANNDLSVKGWKILRHVKNGGLSAARNTGLDYAKGEYIYFLDSDDWIEPNAIELMVNEIMKGFSLITFNHDCLLEGVKVDCSTFASNHFQLCDGSTKLIYIANYLFKHKSAWESWSSLFRSDIIKNNKLRFEDNKRIFAEDMYFMLCYISLADSVSIINDCVYHYTIRNNSIMGLQTNIVNNVSKFFLLSKSVYLYYKEHAKFLLKYFPIIHFSIIKHSLSVLGKQNDGYELIQRNADSWGLRMLSKVSIESMFIIGVEDYLLFRLYSIYYVNGNWSRPLLWMLKLCRLT